MRKKKNGLSLVCIDDIVTISHAMNEEKKDGLSLHCNDDIATISYAMNEEKKDVLSLNCNDGIATIAAVPMSFIPSSMLEVTSEVVTPPHSSDDVISHTSSGEDLHVDDGEHLSQPHHAYSWAALPVKPEWRWLICVCFCFLAICCSLFTSYIFAIFLFRWGFLYFFLQFTSTLSLLYIYNTFLHSQPTFISNQTNFRVEIDFRLHQ
jgi:hypothetical protein